MSRFAGSVLLLAALAAPSGAATLVEPQYNWTTETRRVPGNFIDIAVSSDDELFAFDEVSDGSNRMRVFDNELELVREWTFGCFTEPASTIAVGTMRVYVVTYDCAPVSMFALDGVSAITGYSVPSGGTGIDPAISGLAVDDDENLYVAYSILRKVAVFSVAGDPVREFPVCAGDAPSRGLTVSSARAEVYIRCGTSLEIYSTTGVRKLVAAPTLSTPMIDVIGNELLLAHNPGAGQPTLTTLRLDGLDFIDSGARMPDAFALAARDLQVVYGVAVGGRLMRAVRTYRSPIVVPGARIPLPTVTSAGPRAGSTVFDVDYRVSDPDSATVTTAAIAFVQGPPASQFLEVVRLPRTFVEGTAANLGVGIPTAATRHLAWDAAADYPAETGFLDIRFAVMANDGRPLLEVVFLDLDRAALREPVGVPDCGSGALRISRTPLAFQDVLFAYYWLLASGDPGLTLDLSGAPALRGTTGSYAGKVLLDETLLTSDGIAFLLDRQGLREATAAELACAREGTTPGVQQYPPSAVPLAKPAGQPLVNELGLQLEPVVSGIWVVDP